MKRIWLAFREGASRSLRYWQVLILLYLASLISVLPLVAIPAISLAGSANRTSIQQAADGIEAWAIIETLAARTREMSQGPGASPAPDLTKGLAGILVAGLLAVVVGPVLAWLTSAFLSGGALLVYSEAPQPFRWRRFLWGCWHWFGAFLILGLVQILLAAVVFLPLGFLGWFLASRAGWLGWVIGPLVILAAIFGLAVFELTRLAAVSGGTRHLTHATGAAVRFLFQRLPALAGFYAMALFCLGLIHATFRLWFYLALPLEVWPLAILGQQGFILLRLWARGARLAGGAALYLAGRP